MCHRIERDQKKINEIKLIETREIKSYIGTSKFRKTRKPEWLKNITVRPGNRIVVIPSGTQEQKVFIGYFCVREETSVQTFLHYSFRFMLQCLAGAGLQVLIWSCSFVQMDGFPDCLDCPSQIENPQ